MSEDIVKRLAGLKRMLALAFGEGNEQATIADGINAIERLTAERDELRAERENNKSLNKHLTRARGNTQTMKAERDALRAVLAKIRRDYSSAFMPEDAARIDAALNKGDGDE